VHVHETVVSRGRVTRRLQLTPQDGHARGGTSS